MSRSERGSVITDPLSPPARRAYSIEGAAAAGLVFAVLHAAVELIFLSGPRVGGPVEEAVAYYSDPGNRSLLILAFNLAAFSAIAFLWFIAVLRRRIGHREDQFFATVFLSSGVLFVALFLVGLGIRVAPAAGFDIGERFLDAGDISIVAGASRLILVVALPRMQAVFVVVTSTIGLRTGAIRRWLAIVGYLFALVLTIVPTVVEVPGLGFGLWVALISGSMLVRRRETAAADE